ncbi:neurogenic locus Notch protein-like isoform X2 [Dreissena polymorpha]|uniref:neurogenic locus Notch protein-like isoform X2 n=1 Tax=Dreissena polymorpha TaxID=45954 RepID=UPI0022641D54|nr:neurogenic locus Notch protein-like isoform X2 [Dreissena polymorpha]XP_052273101.1 neurogenic locus Notch protein-like isoform X2 [Dreissena polymorpha]
MDLAFRIPGFVNLNEMKVCVSLLLKSSGEQGEIRCFHISTNNTRQTYDLTYDQNGGCLNTFNKMFGSISKEFRCSERNCSYPFSVCQAIHLYWMKYARRQVSQAPRPRQQLLIGPTLKDTSITKLIGLYVFPSQLLSNKCSSYLSYKPASTLFPGEVRTLCLKVSIEGKQGEERCFRLKIVANKTIELEGPCKEIACYRNSLCIANLGNNTADCRCQDVYTGTDCNINVDECKSNPCSNGGTCKDMINKYQCQCANGYFGSHCQIDINCNFEKITFCGWRNAQRRDNFDWILYRGPTPSDGTGSSVDHTLRNSSGNILNEIDECVSQPCQHGGQCVDSLNHYTYMCLDGFDGEHCQNVLNPCYDTPCIRGTCFSHLSLSVCVCPPGYSGKFCEKGQGGAFDSHPCHYGDTCTQNATTFMCTCPLGFEGSLCQKDIDECSSNPFRSNGICHDETGVFRCECPHGYSGLDCSNGHERKCFSCQRLGRNITCNRATTCKPDEVCYVESSSTSIGAHSFSVGCRRKAECINSTIYNCTYCCDKDYCNDGG